MQFACLELKGTGNVTVDMILLYKSMVQPYFEYCVSSGHHIFKKLYILYRSKK